MLGTPGATVTGRYPAESIEFTGITTRRGIHVITQLFRAQAVAGKESEVEAAFREVVAAVKANESGPVVAYSLHRLESDPTVFIFYEQFADDAALAAHGQSAHIAKLMGALRGNLAGRPVSERLTKLAGIE